MKKLIYLKVLGLIVSLAAFIVNIYFLDKQNEILDNAMYQSLSSNQSDLMTEIDEVRFILNKEAMDSISRSKYLRILGSQHINRLKQFLEYNNLKTDSLEILLNQLYNQQLEVNTEYEYLIFRNKFTEDFKNVFLLEFNNLITKTHSKKASRQKIFVLCYIIGVILIVIGEYYSIKLSK